MATLSVHMDEELKNQFEEFCKDVGLSTNTAVCLFVEQVLKQQKIPFELTASPKKTGKRIGAGVGILPPLPENFDEAFKAMDKEIEESFHEEL